MPSLTSASNAGANIVRGLNGVGPVASQVMSRRFIFVLLQPCGRHEVG